MIHQHSMGASNESDKISLTQLYLMNYGYLKAYNDIVYVDQTVTNDFSIGDLGKMNNATLIAIRTFQQFHNLEATGELNDEVLELMERPRCGCPDITTKATAIWNTDLLSWGVAHHGQDFPGMSYNDVTAFFQIALNIWSQSTFFRFDYLENGVDGYPPDRRPPGDRTNPRNISSYLYNSYRSIIKVRARDYDGSGRTLAYAYLPDAPPDYRGCIYFDRPENWVTTSPASGGTHDIISTAAHELGHVLGLNHINDDSALMSPYYNGKRTLNTNDLAQFKGLYGRLK
jgi:peptidoglycan hydrolase-like protein with peptidoglycan-binding domain